MKVANRKIPFLLCMVEKLVRVTWGVVIHRYRRMIVDGSDTCFNVRGVMLNYFKQ